MLITNAKAITWNSPNEIFERCALLVRGGIIIEIGANDEMKARYHDEDTLDAAGQYVMPGNICTHTHFYAAFARGLAIPDPAPKDFPEMLQKLWWPLDKSLTLEDVRSSAEVMVLDAIRHGTTTLIDHHASPHAIDGSLDIIAEVIERAGVRGVLCYEVTDRNGAEGARLGIQENLRFINERKRRFVPRSEVTRAREIQKDPRTRVAAMFGLHASLTLSNETLEACKRAAPDGVGFHIHVAEHESDEYDSLGKSGMRVVDRLERYEMLGSLSIVAHAIHVDAREIHLLTECGTWVTHQPRSNMNNGVGVTPVESLLRAGVPVCIGTDGFSHNMWEEWKTAYLLQKVWHRDPRRMNGADIVMMGVHNNAALAGSFFPEAPLGIIMPGAHADLIFVDYHPHTPLTSGNLPWHILFGFNESMITTTIVAGQILMKNRQVLTMDQEAISARARELAPGVWQRYYTYV
jgi:putative selenium metabolism protein SsnA